MTDGNPSPLTSPEDSTPTSPIRPKNPNVAKVSNPAKPTKPAIPGTSELEDPNEPQAEPSPAQKASDAIEQLSQKLASVAQEYADGKINKAQFNAIYRRYSEQREITQRLLERDPDSDAWQSVVKPGHTGFLRDHFSAKIISYGIYALENGLQVTLQGNVRLPQSQLLPILAKIKSVVGQGHTLGAAWRKLKDNNWVLMVPGRYTVAVAIYELEPAVVQRKMAEDVHRDFERANADSLKRGISDEGALVFPHRALLEQ